MQLQHKLQEELNEDTKRDVILFIDDEKICHTLIELILPNFTGYKVVSAYSGEEALSLVNRYYDRLFLILCDVILPDIEGVEVYNLLQRQSRSRKIPFVFQSALRDCLNALEINLQDKVDFLYKPYTHKELMDLINKVAARMGVAPLLGQDLFYVR